MQCVIYLRRPAYGRDQQGLQQQLERVFQRQWGQSSAIAVLAKSREVWRPPADVYETADALLVRVELPGMRDAEIEVALGDTSLHISGVRPEPRAGGMLRYHQMGVNYGAFDLDVFIGHPFEAERASANYDDGFLTVELPKSRG